MVIGWIQVVTAAAYCTPSHNLVASVHQVHGLAIVPSSRRPNWYDKIGGKGSQHARGFEHYTRSWKNGDDRFGCVQAAPVWVDSNRSLKDLEAAHALEATQRNVLPTLCVKGAGLDSL